MKKALILFIGFLLIFPNIVLAKDDQDGLLDDQDSNPYSN